MKRKGVCRKLKNKILLITVWITNRRKVLEENLYIFLFLFSVFSFFFYYFSIPSVHAFSLVDMMKSALDKFEGALSFIKRIEEKGENIGIALEVKLEIAIYILALNYYFIYIHTQVKLCKIHSCLVLSLVWEKLM